MLQDTSGTVREAAALAMASVQDSISRPCLIAALKDPLATVRAQAAYALGLVADSAGLVLLNAAADAEQDATTKQLMYEAGFKAELALRKHDALFLMSYLESDDRDIRTRTAQKLARMPKEELVDATPSVLHAIEVERDPAVRMFLIGALKHCATNESNELLSDLAVSDSLPMIRIAALRALGAKEDNDLLPYFLERMADTDPGVTRSTLEQIQRLSGPLNGTDILMAAQKADDRSVGSALWGLALAHGDEPTRRQAKEEVTKRVRTISTGTAWPYELAEAIRALATVSDPETMALLEGIANKDGYPASRLAALEGRVRIVREQMKRARYASREAQFAMLGDVLRSAMMTGDAGLIAFACEQLSQEDSSAIRIMLPDTIAAAARKPLHPIRDLETLQLLEQVIAKRDGLTLPDHKAPPFNHPILRERLLQLKQGQHYRIVTTKGDIIIATNVNETPGSSLVFDSLVTAGYYNGKSFHRVVPNFVIQGGCPRGDGYGGMPWTLRTEIGSTGFTTGSVGLASAGRDTESCQFFITHVSTPHLDGRYTKFGEVVSGMDVVQRIVVGDRMITVERVE